MKVAILGNIAGVSKEVVLALRGHGIEADLFIAGNELENAIRDMEGQNVLMIDLIRLYSPLIESNRKGYFFRIIKYATRAVYQLGVVIRLLQYDLIHSHTGSLNFSALSFLLFVKFRVKPYLAFATGSDIREVAQFDQSRRGEKMRAFFRNARKTLLLNNDMVSFVGTLGIQRYEFFPFMINEEKHKAKPDIRKPLIYEGKLLCFMMSNLDFGVMDKGSNRRALKMNDRFFGALAEFVKVDTNIHSIVLDRGPDRLIARELVKSLGLESFVTFHLPMTELERIEHLNFADVVVDQFDPGSFGLGALEALSIGKPLITYFRLDCVGETYRDDIPILNAESSDEILVRLLEVREPAVRAEIGIRARRWILKHHSRAAVLQRLVRLYDDTLATKATRQGS